MIVTNNEFKTLQQFICDHAGDKLGTKAIEAWLAYRDDNEDTDTYAVIQVKEYHCVTKIVNEWLPIRISTFVQPFDNERVYPLQQVEKKIDWVY